MLKRLYFDLFIVSWINSHQRVERNKNDTGEHCKAQGKRTCSIFVCVCVEEVVIDNGHGLCSLA